MKIIIDIPEEAYKYTKTTSELGWLTTSEYANAIKNGIPLDDVKAEIEQFAKNPNFGDLSLGVSCGAMKAIEILNNIGKTESEE